MMILFSASIALAQAALLLFAVPVTIPAHEPQARRDAAFADFRKTCGPYSQPFIEYAVSRGITRNEANETAEWGFFMQERMEPGSNTTFASLQLLQIRLDRHSSQQDAGARLLRCADEVAIRHTLYGVPGYDHGVVAGGPSAPRLPSQAAPIAAPKPVTPAEKLPQARPAKSLPWSPEAMSTNRETRLNPKYAAERADALAACSASFNEMMRNYPSANRVEQALEWESALLNDRYIDMTRDQILTRIANLDTWIVTQTDPAKLSEEHFGKCLWQRRLAQLEGSPLATGAVDGSLTPLSIGGQTPPWKQQGKDARVIASDGKSAMDCVKLVELTKTDSSTSGGGRLLSNQCEGPVEIVWCISPGECERERGNMWTVRAGKSWPVSANGEVRWAACHGANTAAHVKGSYGLRYYCSAPAK